MNGIQFLIHKPHHISTAKIGVLLWGNTEHRKICLMAEVMHPRIKRTVQVTFRRDEVKVITFDTMPLHFTFTDFEAEGEEFITPCYETLCSTGIKKGKLSSLLPKCVQALAMAT